MLENISWSTYWVWVTVILLTYYTFIIIYFYGFQIRKVFFKISMSPGSQAQNDADLFATVHVLINDIENSFTSLHRQTSKQECLEILQMHISRFPQLKNTAFQKAVNNRVTELLYNKCSIQISEQELAVVWTGDE